MSHNITVESGKSIRLLTSGKYCDRDIIVTATGGEIPMAYTVSSVDELPSDVVDGSLAIVPSDSIKGNWEWKDNTSPLDVSMLIPNGLGGDFVISCGVKGFDEMIGLFPKLYFKGNEGEFAIYMGDTPLTIDGVWDDAYTKFSLYTDVLSFEASFEQNYLSLDNFRSFIKTNCNRLSGGYSLYTRENGEWVEVAYEMGSGESSSEDLEALGALCDWEVIINSGGPSLLAISNYHPSYYLHCRIDMFEGGTTQEQHSDIVVPPNSTVSIEVMLALTNGESRVEVNDVRWKASET